MREICPESFGYPPTSKTHLERNVDGEFQVPSRVADWDYISKITKATNTNFQHSKVFSVGTSYKQHLDWVPTILDTKSKYATAHTLEWACFSSTFQATSIGGSAQLAERTQSLFFNRFQLPSPFSQMDTFLVKIFAYHRYPKNKTGRFSCLAHNSNI